jgi:site-specific recombinase XerD
MRVLQELMGHRDFATTLVYADYAPSEHEASWVEAAFAPTIASELGADAPRTS